MDLGYYKRMAKRQEKANEEGTYDAEYMNNYSTDEPRKITIFGYICMLFLLILSAIYVLIMSALMIIPLYLSNINPWYALFALVTYPITYMMLLGALSLLSDDWTI